jgi:hypothetical protein
MGARRAGWLALAEADGARSRSSSERFELCCVGVLASRRRLLPEEAVNAAAAALPYPPAPAKEADAGPLPVVSTPAGLADATPSL